MEGRMEGWRNQLLAYTSLFKNVLSYFYCTLDYPAYPFLYTLPIIFDFSCILFILLLLFSIYLANLRCLFTPLSGFYLEGGGGYLPPLESYVSPLGI